MRSKHIFDDEKQTAILNETTYPISFFHAMRFLEPV